MSKGVTLKLYLPKLEKKERAHSPFSASGAERWFECPGSVELCKDLPDKDSPWSIEGTLAHAVLEKLLLSAIELKAHRIGEAYFSSPEKISREMIQHAVHAANFILNKFSEHPHADIEVETRIYLEFIHQLMFGTYDGAVIDHFDILHVFDFKYGAGHSVSPVKNLQMIFYALGLAHKHNWNFKTARLWIVQPRIKGYDGPVYWDISMQTLQAYAGEFRQAVKNVEDNPKVFKEGSWCHWCKGKAVCPLKVEARMEKAKMLFKPIKKGYTHGKEESEEKGFIKEARQKSKAKGKEKSSEENFF